MKVTDANIRAICRAIDFIEHNLKEDITIADIADAAYYSLFHFSRMFNTLTHHTPYDYLMRRRLSESAHDLIQTNRKIIEIAFDYEFNSPEVYARAFKRMFGVQPNQWKKHNKIPAWTLMPKLSAEHIQHIHKGQYLKPVVVEIESFYVIGLMTLVKDEQKDVSELWDMFLKTEEKSERTVSPIKYYGITCYLDNWEEHGYFYMAGVQIETPSTMNPVFVIKRFPSSQYIRFIHKGSQKELYLTRNYIYHTWFPKSVKSSPFPLEIECYGQDLNEADTKESEREIYIPI